MVKILRSVAVVLLATSVACAVTNEERERTAAATEPAITITGKLAFREGVTPPSGTIARVTLTDFSLPEDHAPVIAASSIELDNSQVLFPFELSVPMSRLETNSQYVVRGIVHDSQGETLWTTEMAQLIDLGAAESDVGVLMLVPAAR